MESAVDRAPLSRVGTRAVGFLAVAGVALAFSLSSTLVKRAETPGALIAFWRMTIVAVTWNLYLAVTGCRVRAADLRQTLGLRRVQTAGSRSPRRLKAKLRATTANAASATPAEITLRNPAAA